MARDAANALLDALAGAIPTQTFIDHTASELDEEGMEVPPPPLYLTIKHGLSAFALASQLAPFATYA